MPRPVSRRPPAVKIAASRQPAVKTNALPPRKSRLAAIFKHLYSRKAEIQSSTMQENMMFGLPKH